ncbi:MAG: PadR family transcriptional regulator [Candidatus Acidiferrum sp.]
MTSIQFAVLGMLKLRPMTGYEIRQAYQKGPANFMPISFGQIYPALAKLGKEKLVRQDQQPGSRGSIRYFITGKGEEALRSWLFYPNDPANHRELLLRLFFAGPAELAGLNDSVQAFRKEEEARLARYEDTHKWLDDTHASNPRLPIWKLVMEYGVLQSESRRRWADRALALMASRNRRKKQ